MAPLASLLLGLAAGAAILAVPDAASAQGYGRFDGRGYYDSDRSERGRFGRSYDRDDDDDGPRRRYRRFDDRFERDYRRPRVERGRRGDDDDDD